MLAPSPTIRLTPSADGFDVEILPPPAEGASFDQSFASYKAARSYARGIRLVTGWVLIDLAAAVD
jgi:hypothetical protein